jgi:hypothetical protein
LVQPSTRRWIANDQTMSRNTSLKRIALEDGRYSCHITSKQDATSKALSCGGHREFNNVWEELLGKRVTLEDGGNSLYTTRPYWISRKCPNNVWKDLSKENHIGGRPLLILLSGTAKPFELTRKSRKPLKRSNDITYQALDEHRQSLCLLHNKPQNAHSSEQTPKAESDCLRIRRRGQSIAGRC